MKCDICKEGESVGVYGTSVPMSLAFCLRCVASASDPVSTFEDWLKNPDYPSEERRQRARTYENGEYWTWSEWLAKRTGTIKLKDMV